MAKLSSLKVFYILSWKANDEQPLEFLAISSILETVVKHVARELNNTYVPSLNALSNPMVLNPLPSSVTFFT